MTRTPKAPPITAEESALLLSGFRAKFAPNSTKAARDEAIRSLVATNEANRPAAAPWTEHEDFLRVQAAKLTVKPAFPVRGGGPLLFWAESLAARLREHGGARRGVA